MYIATRPGRNDKANEDYVGATTSSAAACAVVLDGAGGPSELPTGCTHGTPWYVGELGARALHHMRDPGRRLASALADAIGDVTRAHADVCDINHPGTPSSTVVMARVTGNLVDYLVLGDSTLVVDTGRNIAAVSDRRIDDVATAEYKRMASLPTGTPEHQAARLEFVTQQRLQRNRVGGYWIASSNPDAAHHAFLGSFALDGGGRVALLSDGSTRFVEFGLGTWSDLLDVLGSASPDHLFDRVRAAEADDPAGERWPRAKRRDDVAAVYLDIP